MEVSLYSFIVPIRYLFPGNTFFVSLTLDCVLPVGFLGWQANFQAKSWNWWPWCWNGAASGMILVILLLLSVIFYLVCFVINLECRFGAWPSIVSPVQAFQKLIYVSNLVFGNASTFLLPWKRVFKVTDSQVFTLSQSWAWLLYLVSCDLVILSRIGKGTAIVVLFFHLTK